MSSKKPNDPNALLNELWDRICCLKEEVDTIVSGGVGWALTGNVVSPINFIGTTNGADFIIKTFNGERMRVTSMGLIGVNTSAPTATLDLNGTFRFRGGNPGAGKILTSDPNGNATWQNSIIPTINVTGVESGLHLNGTIARWGGELKETAAILNTRIEDKVIFQGLVGLVNGDYTDAYVQINASGEGPALGIHSEQDGISINAMGNGVNVTGGTFGVSTIGETTGIVAVGNQQNGGDFSGLHGGLNVTYGRNDSNGNPSDFGIKVISNGLGAYGTPIEISIPNFSSTLATMINMRQSTNNVIQNGYGQAIRFSYGQPGGGSTIQAINEIRSNWSNVGTLTNSFQIHSPIPGNLLTLQAVFTMFNNGQLQLNRYIGATPFSGTAGTRMLAVDTTTGAVVTMPLPTGGGTGTLSAANNGLTVTGGTTVQLGQAIGAVGDPGALLSNRQIPLAGFEVAFVSNAADTSINSAGIQINNAQGDALTIAGGYLGQLNGIKVTNPLANPLSSAGLNLGNDTGNYADIYLGANTHLKSADTLVVAYRAVKIVGTQTISFNVTDDANNTSISGQFNKNQNLLLGTVADGDAKLYIVDTVADISGQPNSKNGVKISPTWNTTGFPTALNIAVNDTASNVASLLIEASVNSNSLFEVDKLGNVLIANQVTIQGGVPGVGKILTSDVNGKASWGDPFVPTVVDASNGLILSALDKTVRWGGPLTSATLVTSDGGQKNIQFSGINTNANPATLQVSTIGTQGTAIEGKTSNGYGVTGIATATGTGVFGYSSGNGTGIAGYSYTPAFAAGTGTGVYGQTGTGQAIYGFANSTGTAFYGTSGSGLGLYINSSLKVFRMIFDNPTAPSSGVHIVGSFEKTTTSQPVAGAGFGMAIEYQLANSTGTARQAGTHQFVWADAVDATRTSLFNLTLMQGGSSVTPMIVSGNKSVQFNGVTDFADSPFGFFSVANNGSGNAANIRNLGAGPAASIYSAGSVALLVSGGAQFGSGNVSITTGQDNLALTAPLLVNRQTTANNVVAPAVDIKHSISNPTGTTTGFGVSMRFVSQINSANDAVSATLSSKWIGTVDATPDGDFTIATATAGVVTDKFNILPTGQARIHKYGLGNFATGTRTFLLGTTADGTIIEQNIAQLGITLDWDEVLNAGGEFNTDHTAYTQGFSFFMADAAGSSPFLKTGNLGQLPNSNSYFGDGDGAGNGLYLGISPNTEVGAISGRIDIGGQQNGYQVNIIDQFPTGFTAPFKGMIVMSVQSGEGVTVSDDGMYIGQQGVISTATRLQLGEVTSLKSQMRFKSPATPTDIDNPVVGDVWYNKQDLWMQTEDYGRQLLTPRRKIVGTINQSGTNAPTFSQVLNNSGYTLTLAYAGVGLYTGTLAGTAPLGYGGNWTIMKGDTQYLSTADKSTHISVSKQNATTFWIRTWNNALADTDALLNNLPIEITFY